MARWYGALRRAIVVGLGTLLAIATYAIAIEPNWLAVRTLDLALPHLEPEFQGYRVAQISDIHLADGGADGMSVKRLHRFVTAINRLSPDLIAITGDFFTVTPSDYADDLARELGRLQANDRVVAVLGNHDHWVDPQNVRDALAAAGVIELRNDIYTLERYGQLLTIAGVDDAWQHADDLPHVLTLLPATGSNILLVHEPDFADTSAPTNRFDLQLSGHSHGGQIRLPFVPPLKLPYLAVKYPQGLYRVGNMLEYTNVGIGTIGLPARLFCRPEVTVFTLKTDLDVNAI
ncbi:MAG: metallophosphoesterase [Cyanobacteria bacterium P01_A01_bin.3]